MRGRGTTSPKTNQTAATDALIALARLLARQAAREWLGQTAAPPEITKHVDPKARKMPAPEHLRASEIAHLSDALGDDGAASDLLTAPLAPNSTGRCESTLKLKEIIKEVSGLGKP